MRNVSPNDAQEFWRIIDRDYPELGKQLQNRQIIDGSIICFRPKTMSAEDFEKYEQLLRSWYRETGFS